MTYDALGNKTQEAPTLLPLRSCRDYGTGSTILNQYVSNASHLITYGYDSTNASASANREVMLSESSVAGNSGSGGYGTVYNPTAYGFWNGGSDAAASYPVNADNQLAVLGITFDGDGNPTTYKSATFGFDAEDRLTSISSPAFSAAYDGDGLRATKTAAGVTTYFLYDGSDPIAEETFNGTSATFTALDGGRLACPQAGQPHLPVCV